MFIHCGNVCRLTSFAFFSFFHRQLVTISIVRRARLCAEAIHKRKVFHVKASANMSQGSGVVRGLGHKREVRDEKIWKNWETWWQQ